MRWDREMQWMSPPKSVAWVDGELRVVTGLQGDFWRGTYYGFHHHNGHFLHQPAASEFTAELRFRAAFSALYDQAGLMIRADEAHWIKAGVEYVAGVAYFAVVVTIGMSDWSQMALPLPVGVIELRVSRSGDAVWVQYLHAGTWRMCRLAYFPPDLAVEVGPMCCSPSRDGLSVRFLHYELGPLETKSAYQTQ